MKKIAATLRTPVHHGQSMRAGRSKPSVSCDASRIIASLSAALVLLAGYQGSATAAAAAPGVINAIGVENEYADVIGQIGGKYVQVSAIETDPNTDPHTFEVNPKVAAQIASADLIVKNGVGYDAWADKIIAAAPNSQRKVIDVQHLLGLPDSTPNPHLWYDPKTMPAVAKAVAADLSALNPAQAAYFQANVKKFDASLKPWLAAIATCRGDGAGCQLHARSGRHRYRHAVQPAGGDHERHRSLSAGRDEAEQPVHGPQGEGVRL
jgi:zinc/manganese transport system substrate-binding protein